MTSLLLFWNLFVLRRSRLANFAEIVKITAMLIKATFKDSKSWKIRNHVLKCNLYLYFLISQKLLISGEKSWSQQNSRAVSRYLYVFWIFFKLGIAIPSSTIALYVRQILRRGPFVPLILEQSQKGASWRELKQHLIN